MNAKDRMEYGAASPHNAASASSPRITYRLLGRALSREIRWAPWNDFQKKNAWKPSSCILGSSPCHRIEEVQFHHLLLWLKGMCLLLLLFLQSLNHQPVSKVPVRSISSQNMIYIGLLGWTWGRSLAPKCQRWCLEKELEVPEKHRCWKHQLQGTQDASKH